MSKNYILSEKGNDYKANMHCHTVVSDGVKTPEEVKEAYIKEGYSIVAFTDHEVFIPHNELTDGDFLALNGFEVAINNWTSKDYREIQTTHICVVALDPEIVIQPCWNRNGYFQKGELNYKDKVQFDKNEPDFIKKYTPECINGMMKTYRDKGFFVTYNHPTWSMESYSVYSQYNMMNAVEIMNGGCLKGGYNEYNFAVYDDLLKQNKKLWCIAGDDNHNEQDRFVCWTVIRAEKLTYQDIAESLRSGNFYTTSGPAIKSFYQQDGTIYIETSPARKILFNTGIRHAKCISSTDGGTVTGGTFDTFPNDKYVRATVIAEDGTVAFSNPCYISGK